jgi:hypothetical protein
MTAPSRSITFSGRDGAVAADVGNQQIEGRAAQVERSGTNALRDVFRVDRHADAVARLDVVGSRRRRAIALEPPERPLAATRPTRVVPQLEEVEQAPDHVRMRAQHDRALADGRQHLEQSLHRLAAVEALVHLHGDAVCGSEGRHRLLAAQGRGAQDARRGLVGITEGAGQGGRVVTAAWVEAPKLVGAFPRATRHGTGVTNHVELH